jgi:hypothetical protein
MQSATEPNRHFFSKWADLSQFHRCVGLPSEIKLIRERNLPLIYITVIVNKKHQKVVVRGFAEMNISMVSAMLGTSMLIDSCLL